MGIFSVSMESSAVSPAAGLAQHLDRGVLERGWYFEYLHKFLHQNRVIICHIEVISSISMINVISF